MPAIDAVSSMMNSSIIPDNLPDMLATNFSSLIHNISNRSETLAKTESFGRGKPDAHEMAYRAHSKAKRDVKQNPADQTNDIGRFLELTYPNETRRCLNEKKNSKMIQHHYS